MVSQIGKIEKEEGQRVAIDIRGGVSAIFIFHVVNFCILRYHLNNDLAVYNSSITDPPPFPFTTAYIPELEEQRHQRGVVGSLFQLQPTLYNRLIRTHVIVATNP